MITDLANLGPSLKRTTDLGASRGPDKLIGNPNQKPEASSFDRILKTTSAEKSNQPDKSSQANEKSEQTVRQQQLKRDAVPVQKRMDDRTPDRSSVESSKNEPRTAQKENDNWDEPRSVKENGKSEKVGTKSNSGAQNREQVMLEFMDSMESEFGIPPQRIVEAMTTIPTSEQLSSPEDSASQVIAQLNLNDDQAQKAMALYMGMLAQLKMAQDPAMGKAQMVAAGGAAGAALMANPLSSQQRRNVLNQSLDQMNSKFFMQGPAALKPETQAVKGFQSAVPQMPQDNLLTNGLPQDQVSFGKNPQADKLPDFMQRGEALSKMDSDLAGLQQQMQNVDPNSQEAKTLLKSLAALSASAAALDQGLKTDAKNLQALKAEQIMANPNGTDATATAAAAGGGLSGLAAFGLGGGEGDESDEMGGDRSSPDQQFMVSQPSQHQLPRSENVNSQSSFGAMMAGAAGADGRDVNPADKQANLHQLMNQAQYLIKKGGGEAKIQMAPEGIGQVHMKMTLMDGKVNLEMQAESKEAKKLIESSIGDLKTHLSHHQLTVDQVKVDVGNQTSNESRNQDTNRQQQSMDQRQDQSKQQARDFWSEFSGNNNGGFERRNGFMESPGIRAYGASRRDAPLTSANSGTVSAKRETGSGKGRGLDLVA